MTRRWMTPERAMLGLLLSWLASVAVSVWTLYSLWQTSEDLRRCESRPVSQALRRAMESELRRLR